MLFSGGSGLSSLLVGVCLMLGGGVVRAGRVRVMRRVPGLSDSQQGSFLIAIGVIFVVAGIVTLW